MELKVIVVTFSCLIMRFIYLNVIIRSCWKDFYVFFCYYFVIYAPQMTFLIHFVLFVANATENCNYRDVVSMRVKLRWPVISIFLAFCFEKHIIYFHTRIFCLFLTLIKSFMFILLTFYIHDTYYILTNN